MLQNRCDRQDRVSFWTRLVIYVTWQEGLQRATNGRLFRLTSPLATYHNPASWQLRYGRTERVCVAYGRVPTRTSSDASRFKAISEAEG